MRKRKAAITMNVLDRVMALYREDDAKLPLLRDCPGLVETHYSAMEWLTEGAVRHGRLVVPKPSWDADGKYEEFKGQISEFGLGDVLVPESLSCAGRDYRQEAIDALDRQRDRVRQILARPAHHKLWLEFGMREELEFPCAPNKDVREEWCERYANDAHFYALQDVLSPALVNYLTPRINNGDKRRAELYLVSSILRGYESDLITTPNQNIDYYTFILHEPLGEILAKDQSRLKSPTRWNGPVRGLMSSFLPWALYLTEPGPDAPKRLLANIALLVNQSETQSLRTVLDKADRNENRLKTLAGFINSDAKDDQKDEVKSIIAIAVAMGLQAIAPKIVAGGYAAYVLLRRQKVLSRRIGQSVRNLQTLKKEKFDAMKRFEEIFVNKFDR